MFEQTFKNFKIIFDAVNERCTFSSGDLVSGHISFDLTKETKITSMAVELNGGAHVHWSTGGGGGRKRRRHRKQHSAKLDLFNFKSEILGHMVSSDAVKLQPGTHLYPFSCQLPQGFFPNTFHGVHGSIAYNIKVRISRPWHMSKDFLTEFNFGNRIDTNQPEMWAPLSGSNQMTVCSLWCASALITMAVSVEKKAFFPGETVKISCKFSNTSSRTVTPKAKLVQKQIYYTHNKFSKVMVVKSLASVNGLAFGKQTSVVHTEIRITIPSSASPTISNCSILVVEYFVEVTLSACVAPDLTVLFPIILCDATVHTQSPL